MSDMEWEASALEKAGDTIRELTSALATERAAREASESEVCEWEAKAQENYNRWKAAEARAEAAERERDTARAIAEQEGESSIRLIAAMRTKLDAAESALSALRARIEGAQTFDVAVAGSLAFAVQPGRFRLLRETKE